MAGEFKDFLFPPPQGNSVQVVYPIRIIEGTFDPHGMPQSDLYDNTPP